MKIAMSFFVLFLLLNNAYTQNQNKGLSMQQILAIDPNVKKIVLPNGFTFYFKKNTYPEKKVELRLAINAGSTLETDNQQGLAHFMEHMNFNGTEHFKKNDLVGYLQSIGVRFGADLNAYTGFSETVYILPIPSTDSLIIEKGFQIMQDWSHLALLTEKDIDEERNIVLEESRLNKGAQFRMINKLLPALFEGSAYVNRLPIGKDSILKNFKPDELRSFHKTWYRPDLSALFVVGDMDEAKATALMMKYFADWKNPIVKVVERRDFEVPAMTKNKAAVIVDAEQPYYSFNIEFSPIKTKETKTIEDYKNGLEQALIKMILQLRLTELVQSAKAPFVQGEISIDPTLARNYENVSTFAIIGKAGLKTAIDALVNEIKKAQQLGFLTEELEIAKKQLLSGVENAYNERQKTPSKGLVEELIRNFLHKETIPGIENEYDYTKYILPLITLQGLQTEFNKHLNNAHFYTFIIAPKSEEKTLPNEEQLLQIVENAFASNIVKTTTKTLTNKLLEKEPIAGNILSTTQDKSLDLQKLVLSNGMNVILKTTDYKADQILFQLIENGGTNNFDASEKYSLNNLVSIIEAMGYCSFTPSDLQKILAGKNVSVTPFLSDITHGFNGVSNLQDVETFFQLLHLKATKARIDEDFFISFKDKKKSATEFVLLNPQNNFIDTFYKALYHQHAYSPIIIPHPEHIDKVSLESIKKIYPNFWCNFSNATLLIVGAIKIDTLKPLLEKYVASIANSNKTQNMKDVGLRPLNNNTILKHYKGSDSKSYIMMAINKEATYNEDKSLYLSLLSEILNIKLVEEIREKKSWVYGLNTRMNLNKVPYEYFQANFKFPCGPENVDSILYTTWLEIKTIQQEGPSLINLDKAKKQILETLRERKKTNEFWKNALEDIFIFEKTTAENLLNITNKINAVNTKNIQDVAKEFLIKENSFTGILYPQKK